MKTREPLAQRACDVSPVECNAAGPSAGPLAGAQESLVRSLRCPEMVVLSWGVWYVLAIVITTAVGPAVAPHCLRW